jgi:hypothetical protein
MEMDLCYTLSRGLLNRYSVNTAYSQYTVDTHLLKQYSEDTHLLKQFLEVECSGKGLMVCWKI